MYNKYIWCAGEDYLKITVHFDFVFPGTER